MVNSGYSDVVQIITVDQLLHMRSGLPDYRHFALMTGRDPERLGNKELLDLLVQHPEMMDKPGSRFVYSNTNYDLLAKIVETVAKAHHLIEPNQTFVDFVRDSVFLPYKMSARCSSDPTCLPTIDGFDAKRKQCASEKKQTLEFGSTGVVGRPSDMVHWNQALAGGELNSLLVPSQDIPLDRRENFYCRGLNMRYFEKYRRIAHGGQLDGYISIFRRYEHVTNSNMSFAFFLATNRGSDPRDVEKIADEIANVLAEKPIEHEDPPKVSEETKPVRGCQTEAQDFKGTYICDGFNSQWTVSAKEKEGSWEVHLSPTDQSVPGSLSEPIEFSPRLDQNGLFFQCPGVGRLERTVEGFDIIGERMPRVHFKKN